MIGPVLVGLALSTAGVAGITWAHQANKYERQLDELRSEHLTQQAAAEKARADEEASRRKIEQELVDEQAIHALKFTAARVELDAARAAGRVASGRVRDAARATARLAGQVGANTTASAVRETAAGALDVLADVLSRAEQRATELAGIADDRGIAGRACERLYEEAREKLKAH